MIVSDCLGDDKLQSVSNGASKQASRTIYLDMTDLMDYAKHNSTLSGIQRVVGNLLTNITGWCKANPSTNIVPVIPEYDRYRVLAADLKVVIELIEELETQKGDRRTLEDLIQAIYDSRWLVYPGAGDVFVIAGAFWIYPHYDMIIGLRSRGVQFGLFIHDLIQVTNPEYVQHVATVVFRKALIDALAIVNFVLTNSEFVAQEVRAFLKERLNFSVPVHSVLLATELRPVEPDEDLIGADIRRAILAEYVLCVGTIEIRKNHLYLVKIWDRLIQEFDGEVPHLVFVGKWGWKIDELRSYLDRYSRLGNRLLIFNNASDVALGHLYRNCLFTAYPSFAEGFGLPVVESLAHGKPCVISNTTSLPEVGGRFARYIDPFDLNQGYAVLRSILSDREGLTKWTEEIRAHYTPKTWREFSNEFFNAVVDLASEQENKGDENNCILPAKTIHYIGDDDIALLDESAEPLVTFRMARLSGWHPVERWGCWASEPQARLKFRTTYDSGTKVTVFLLLHVPPGSEGTTCDVSIGGVTTRFTGLTSEATWCSAKGPVFDDGWVDVTLQSSGKFGQPDQRQLYIGIHALAYCENSDVLTRLSFASKPVLSSARRATNNIVRFLSLPMRTRSIDEQRQNVIALVEERLAARDAARKPPSVFHHITQGGDISGPYQIVPPNPAVLDFTAGSYMTTANCLARDFYHERYQEFCRSIAHAPYLHRELWEFAFITEHLKLAGALAPGRRGIGFGVGVTRLPALFASLGCNITATEMLTSSASAGLHDVEARSKLRDRLFYPEICEWAVFQERVDFKHISAENESSTDYDFCWSCGHLDKLGSIDKGLDFVISSVEKFLKIGGVACHTSELNITSNERSIESGNNVLFRKRDIEGLIERLSRHGHEVKPLAFEPGLTFLDTLVDVPPFGGEVHLKLRLGEFVGTSFGVVATRTR